MTDRANFTVRRVFVSGKTTENDFDDITQAKIDLFRAEFQDGIERCEIIDNQLGKVERVVNLDFWLAQHMTDRFETVLGWILLPIVAAIACWWFAEDLQAAGVPIGWTIGIGVALFALYLASVPVRMWMSRKQ